MKNYRKTSHSVYDIKYHVAWIMKYRKQMLICPIAKRLRELIREKCLAMNIEIIKGHISRDLVHLLVSVTPYHSVSIILKRIKGKTSRRMLCESRILAKQCWGRHLGLAAILQHPPVM
jgi:putative transposase